MARYLIDGEYVTADVYREHLKKEAEKAAAAAKKAEPTTAKKASN